MSAENYLMDIKQSDRRIGELVRLQTMMAGIPAPNEQIARDRAALEEQITRGYEDNLSERKRAQRFIDRLPDPVERQALTLLMATLNPPKLLLLDEHTAALDPRTASKVLDLTGRLIAEHHLTTLMVTHNMNDAIRLGNRLIMMNAGHIAVEISGEEKQSLHRNDLIALFEKASGDKLENDRMLLS